MWTRVEEAGRAVLLPPAAGNVREVGSRVVQAISCTSQQRLEQKVTEQLNRAKC